MLPFLAIYMPTGSKNYSHRNINDIRRSNILPKKWTNLKCIIVITSPTNAKLDKSNHAHFIRPINPTHDPLSAPVINSNTQTVTMLTATPPKTTCVFQPVCTSAARRAYPFTVFT